MADVLDSFVPISIGSDDLRVEVLPFGAALIGVWAADRDGRVTNVVLRHDDLFAYATHTTNSYLGATVGRYANRIAGARVEIDDVAHRLIANNGPNTLHGGPIGWAFRPWSVVACDRSAVELELIDCDGEQGFPGRVTVRVRYAVDGGTVSVSAVATTDAPTVVSMTNHAYWNLAGGGVIDGHDLWLDSGRCALVDDAMLPTGSFATIDEGRVPLGRWDNWFEFSAGRDEGDPAARLVDPLSGRALTMWTDQPGAQVYTGDGLKADFIPRVGVCVEAGTIPNSPDACVLRPGETYRWSVRCQFGIAV